MNTLYKVVQIPGKDLGCVALKDIKKGTLILQEIPQCFAQGSGPAQIGKCTYTGEKTPFYPEIPVILIPISKM